MFDGMKSTNSSQNPIDAVRELFSLEEIEGRTDVELSQIQIIIQIKQKVTILLPYFEKQNDYIYERLNGIDEKITYFLKIVTSKGRKSRDEFVESLKGLFENLAQDSLAGAVGLLGKR